MKVILDTSTIVSGLITPTGTAARIINHWAAGDFALLYSPVMLEELTDVLQRAWLKERLVGLPQRIPDFLDAVTFWGQLVPGYSDVHGYVRDPFDEMFLACARLGGADVIVSLDKDLLSLEEFEGTRILRPPAFLELLEPE